MNYLHVVHIIDSLGLGGLEKGVVTLANNTSADIRHTILCLRTSGPSARRLPDDAAVIAMGKSAGNSLAFLRRLAAEINRLAPDVVHTRNWGGMDGILAARMASMKNIVHGEHGWDLADSLGQSRKRRLVRRALSLATCEFIAVSQAIKAWLEEDVRICRPVTQIYNGVDTELFRADGDRGALRRELGLSANSMLIGIVARLDPIKDHPTLLRAFAGIANRHPDAHLVVAGDGPARPALERHGVRQVHFLGSRSDIPDLLRGLDLFVLTSLNEGISNTILEAMASGLPVVASRVGGNPELVREGVDGMLFPAGNVENLAKCLDRYLGDENSRRKHGKNARERALEKFSVQAMVAQYEEVWRRVAR